MKFFKKKDITIQEIRVEMSDMLKKLSAKAIYVVDNKGGMHSALSDNASVPELIGLFSMLTRQYQDVVIKSSEERNKNEELGYIG